MKRQVSLLQIAVPSRGQIEAYRRLKTELETLVGEVNGRHSDVDWTPIRYLNKGFAQSTLAGFYRMAQVGLVTPLQDGMNLVAKEYVAAQNPSDPGVLVPVRIRRCRKRARYRRAGESARYRRHGPENFHGAAHAARGAARTLACDDRQAENDFGPVVVLGFYRRARECAAYGGAGTASRPATILRSDRTKLGASQLAQANWKALRLSRSRMSKAPCRRRRDAAGR